MQHDMPICLSQGGDDVCWTTVLLRLDSTMSTGDVTEGVLRPVSLSNGTAKVVVPLLSPGTHHLSIVAPPGTDCGRFALHEDHTAVVLVISTCGQMELPPVYTDICWTGNGFPRVIARTPIFEWRVKDTGQPAVDCHLCIQTALRPHSRYGAAVCGHMMLAEVTLSGAGAAGSPVVL